MFKPGFILTTDEQFDAAIFNGSNVSVWQAGEIIEYGGEIESHTQHAVKINGAYYLKVSCEFKIR